MASRRDYFYRQLLTEAELDAGFEGLEVADRFMMADNAFTGVVANAVVSQHSPGTDLTVDVSGQGILYDQAGERIFIPSLQTVDMSVDSNNVATAVAVGGNEKWVSLQAKFKRALSDPRLDGNSNTVYFVRDESFDFVKVQGAEAAIGVAVRPSLSASNILLADVRLINGQTQILNADVSTTRRQDVFAISGTPRALSSGTTKAALTAFLGYYNNHVTGAADKHAAADLNYAGGVNWFDGTTNPAATVEAQLDKIITDLLDSSGTDSGAHKIGCAARTTWLGGRTNAANVSIFAAIDKIITDLADTTINDDGSERVGSHGYTGTSYTLTDGSVRSQLNAIVDNLAGLAASNIFTGATNEFRGDIKINLAAKSFRFGSSATSDSALMKDARAGTGTNAGDLLLIWGQQGQGQAGGANNNNGGNVQAVVGAPGVGGAGLAGMPGHFVISDSPSSGAGGVYQTVIETTIAGAGGTKILDYHMLPPSDGSGNTTVEISAFDRTNNKVQTQRKRVIWKVKAGVLAIQSQTQEVLDGDFGGGNEPVVTIAVVGNTLEFTLNNTGANALVGWTVTVKTVRNTQSM